MNARNGPAEDPLRLELASTAAEPLRPEFSGAADESLRLELQEALSTFRHWTTQANQVGGVVATADAALVAYAFSQKLAGALFVASVVPVVLLFVYLQAMSTTAHIILLALKLERKLGIRKESLALTYARLHLRPIVTGPTALENIDDDELLAVDADLSKRRWLRKQIPIALYLATLAQIAIAFVALVVYHYRFM